MSSGAAESGDPDELWAARLHAALRGVGTELSPRELSDALWLALHTPPGRTAEAGAEPYAPARPAATSGLAARPDPSERNAAEPTPSEPPRPVYTFIRTRDGGAPGTPLRIPGVRGLRHPLGLVRGLRALKRQVPSLHRHELDEGATAEAIADSGVLDAVLQPARDRWLHLVLAVDEGPSMRVWRDTVGELQSALTGSGIFRSVRAGPLDAAAALVVAGRTVVLAVTDGVADHWYTGSARRRLAVLARRAPTAVLHLFPPRLWNGTGLAAEPAIVRTTGPAPPNTLLTAHDPWLTTSSRPRPGLPVPVLALEELSLRPWADLIASHGGVATLRVIDALAPGNPRPFDDETGDLATEEPDTAADRVSMFRASASRNAYELAGHLAAVDPLTLPVMRLVQAAALPDSHPVCLAEVMLSGLMHVDEPLVGHDVFAFPPEVRSRLRAVVRAGAAQRTVDAVSDFITPRLGRTPDFPAVIADRTGTLSLPREGEPLAEWTSAGAPRGEGSYPGPQLGRAPLLPGTHNLPDRRTVRWHPALHRDVTWVDETLAGRGRHRAAALCGPAGSDKTTVALDYAYRRLKEYTLVWWVDAREPDGVESGIASIAHALLTEPAPDSARIHPTERALQWLESHPGWLLVLDHVTDAVKVTELADRIGAYGHLLMTVRTHESPWDQFPARDLTPAYRDRHDLLTGLRNAPTIDAQLSDLLCVDPQTNDDPHHTHLRSPQDEPQADRKGLAVLFCSLNGLESINDRFGRSAGDIVLVEVARRLCDTVRDDDTVARVGGDEFLVLVGQLDPAEAQNLAARLRNEIIAPIGVDGRAVSIGADIGVGWAQCGISAQRVIDVARDKSRPRGRGLGVLVRLTDALSTLSCLEDVQGRAIFALLLAEQLGRPINLHGAELRRDVVIMARAALNAAGGADTLIDVVRVFEGEAASWEIRRLFDEAGAESPRAASQAGATEPRDTRISLALMQALTDALCELDCMQDAPGRGQFAAVLADLLGRRIELRGSKQREDAATLVRAALDTVGGEHALADAARILEGTQAGDEVARRMTAASDSPVPRVLSAGEEGKGRALLRAVTADLSVSSLREALVHDLNGLRLPAGLSLEQLFAYTLELTAQSDGLPPAVLLVERASRLTSSPTHRSALAACAEIWAADMGLSGALRRRRAAAGA
ncbi:GGDEF domain-containing protein [Streptomyces sp. NBC_00647]|uniref:SAV_2336 N-terminal domain-related protein n=1 Tax=Streptomyces sp. NBC_00647 TaxID=2975796 RepID=UPI0032566F74